MGETTDQIESHIENRREDLGSNLNELEQKVKAVTDWRQQFQKNPKTMIGAAFGGGVLLASMMGGRKRSSRGGASPLQPETLTAQGRSSVHAREHDALEVWDTMKGALIGVAASQFKNLLGQLVPGFQEQYHKAETEKDAATRGVETAH
jgi:hypothetical protein